MITDRHQTQRTKILKKKKKNQLTTTFTVLLDQFWNLPYV